MAEQFRVHDTARIDAPVDRCFLLSTSIELVQRTLGMSPSAAQSKKSTGLIEAGDQLLWRGWKFGLPQLHETFITGYSRPTFFQDTMGRGRFAAFQHDHTFTPSGDRATLLEDEVRFTMPFAWAGALVGRFIMVPYVRALVRRRFALLKQVAEGSDWQRYLPAGER